MKTSSPSKAKLSVLLLTFVTLTTGSLLTLYTPCAVAQGGVPLWTNVFGPGRACCIAVDNSGDVLVAGNSGTIKYSGEGVALWTNRFNADDLTAIATDGSGNAFVLLGAYNGNGYDGFTIKYSGAGVPLWTNRLDSGVVPPAAIAVDSSGNVFVAGDSGNETNHDFVTLAFSNSGALLWTNRYHRPGYSSGARAIAVDSTGNVFVTGDSSSGDYVTVGYSNAGLPLWTNRYHGATTLGNVAIGIAVDNSGDVFVTGYSRDASGDTDYETIAYSNSGMPLWTNRYSGPASFFNDPYAIAVDSSGNVFVTGASYDAGGSNPDYATVAYSRSGVPLLTNYYDGPDHQWDVAFAIAVDSAGNVFVTGRSVRSLESWDYATVAYSSTGELLWENRYNRPESLASWPHAIAVDRAGNVFVTGWALASDGYYYYTTIKYSSSLLPQVHLDFQTLNNQLVLSWTNAGFNLQTAPAVTGPFTNLPAATSPYTNPLAAPQQFFRLKGD